MLKRIVINALFFYTFIIGVLLCKTEKLGFYGNSNGLIGFPLCIVSELCIIIWTYYSLVKQLERDDINTRSRRSILINTTISNAIICFFGVLFFKLLNGSVSGTVGIIFFMILGYNIPLAVKRKDLILSIICLSVIMFALSCILCLNMDVMSFYSSIYKKR